jgi:predicted RecB family endonuclease
LIASKKVQTGRARVNAARQAFVPAKYTGFFTKLLKNGAKKMLCFHQDL